MNGSLSITPKRGTLVVFFVLSFVIAWACWIPAALAEHGQLSSGFPVGLAGLLGAWAPSLTAIIMTAAGSGGRGLRALFGRLAQWRLGIRWYLFALLWPAALSLATTALSMLLGNPAPDFAHPPVITEYPAPPEAFAAGFLPLLPVVFLTQVFGSSLGEELGWRGFALPRLQSGWSALLASVVLGLIWGLWHLPRFWTPGQTVDYAAFAMFVLSLTLSTVLYTWLFNNTRGSLVPAVLLHTSQAVITLFLARIPSALLEIVLLALTVSVVVAFTGPERLARPRPSEGGRTATASEQAWWM